MVMEVAIKGNGAQEEILAPQVLVESGKVESINVAYALMHQVASGAGVQVLNLPPGNFVVHAQFTVTFFSAGGERTAAMDCDLRLSVSEDRIFTFVGDKPRETQTWAHHYVRSATEASDHPALR